MHMLIVLAAFALCAVAPYMGPPKGTDMAQLMDEMNDLDQAPGEADEDDGSHA